MTKRKPTFYTAEYWREGSNWLVELVEEPRVHTFARSLAKAEEHIRDASTLWFEKEVPLEHVCRDLPAETSEIVCAAREARAEMASAEERAAEATREGAHRLMAIAGFSLRDAAHLLGISHQRLHQLVREPAERS
ncbi:MAG: type II toxin-antitoxin system HicB family antitoxin [Acidimicrobiales bacterium]